MSQIFPIVRTMDNSVEQELRDELRFIRARVEALPDEQVVRPELEAALADDLVDSFMNEAIVLGEPMTESETEQIQVIETNPMYFGPGGRRPTRKLDRFVVKRPLLSGSTHWFAFRPNASLPVPSDSVVYDPGRRAIVTRVVSDLRDDPTGAQEQEFLQSEMSSVDACIVSLNEQLAAWNEQLPATCRSLIAEERGRRLARDQRLRQLGPRVIEDGVPVPYPLPRRRASRVRLNPAEMEKLGGRPVLPQEDFLAVLVELQRAAQFFAEHPAISELHEEGQRDFVLAILNAAFPSGATGETFSKRGKTDIRVMTTPAAASGFGDCIFKAECKVWKSPKTASDAFDQLADKYLTSLEVRAAIVMFVPLGEPLSEVAKAAVIDLVERLGAVRIDNLAGWPAVRLSHESLPHPIELAVVTL